MSFLLHKNPLAVPLNILHLTSPHYWVEIEQDQERGDAEGKCEPLNPFASYFNLSDFYVLLAPTFLKHTFCTKFASRGPSAKRCSRVRGRMEELFWTLPKFKKLIDDAQAPRMSLQKFSSEKSGWRERERIFFSWFGLEKKLRHIDPRG